MNNQIEKKNPSSVPVVRELLEKNQESLAQALPKHIDPQRLMRVVLTGLTMNPTLQKCTTNSLMASLLRCALYGLEPDGVEAALVPFYDGKNKRFEAQLQPMYQGVIKLARQSGEITLFYAETVHENDEFFMQKGLQPKLEHTPALKGDRGEPIGAYAVFKFRDSNDADFEYMTGAEIQKIADGVLSKIQNEYARKYSPWVTYPLEMWKKTVIKRLAKRAPKSFALRDVIRHDDSLSAGAAPSAALDKMITDGAGIQGLPEPEPDITEPQAIQDKAPEAQEQPPEAQEPAAQPEPPQEPEQPGVTSEPPVLKPQRKR